MGQERSKVEPKLGIESTHLRGMGCGLQAF
jgi:hypothetical protein